MQAYGLLKKLGLVAGPLLFLLLFYWPGEPLLTEAADKVLAVAAWMVCWWITEAVSISVTALLPLLLFPLFGIAEMKDTASHYGSPVVFLFFGGFVMALALEKVNLHTRIALNIIQLTGTTPDRVVLGFMIATALLSMWISNTATTVVMLPIGLSVIELLRRDADGFTDKDRNFALSLMLGIAFAANVGGIATIIGTPPNTVMVGVVEKDFGMEVSFVNWMMMGVPFSAIMLVLIYLVLVKWIYPNGLPELDNSRSLIDAELAKLGPLSGLEKRVLLVFFVAIVLWVMRLHINNWVPQLQLSDTGIAMLAALLLFALPYRFGQGEFVLEWPDTTRLPWGILLLFGGGLALASGLKEVGIIDMIGTAVEAQNTWSTFAVMAILVAVILFMTELMSNVALVAVFVPVVAGIALGLDADMLHLLIPITMASSCAFMLPMATPPNAIVFASGYVKVSEMARAGLILNLLAILLIISFAKWVVPVFF